MRSPKKGKRKAGEKTKPATDFKQAACCPSVVQGQHSQKIKGSVGVTGTLRKSNSPFDPTQTGSGTVPPREAAVDWCRCSFSFY